METTVLPLGRKPDDYTQHARADVVARIPPPLGCALDVGCGAGGVGRELRARGATRLVGVELDAEAAEIAASTYDEVLTMDALEALPFLEGQAFDTIVCYDILEHLYDPAALLAGLHELTAPGGKLHVSVPNARHASLFRDLYLRGTFGYTTWGHRDSTHIRWFTRKDMVRLLEESGWKVAEVATHPFKPYRRVLTTLSGGVLRDLFAVQWFILARP